MKKTNVIRKYLLPALLAAVIALAPFGAGAAKPVSAADAKRVLINPCDNFHDFSKAAVSLDYFNFVTGKSSIYVMSSWPNAFMDIRTDFSQTGIAYEEAYFEFYLRIKDITRHQMTGAMVRLNGDGPRTYDNNFNKKGFYWTWSTGFSGLKEGWNYVALKFTAATYKTGSGDSVDVGVRRAAYLDVKQFFIVWQTYNDFLGEINLDCISLTDTPRVYDAANPIPFTEIARMSDVAYVQQEQEDIPGGGRTDNQRLAVIISFSAAGALLLAGTGLVLFTVLKNKRRAKA